MKMNGVGRQILGGIKAFCREDIACMRVDGERSERFLIAVSMRQRCVMLPWMFNTFIDECKREMEDKVGNVDVRVNMNGMGWAVVACLFADDTLLFAEREKELQRVVDENYTLCTRMNLK